jgi:hypothetical protein
MSTVLLHGKQIDFDAAVNLMDDELREQIHSRGTVSEQDFLDQYAVAHADKFQQSFQVA